MSINTQCGFCGQPYLLDDQYAGQSVTCAKCGQTFLAHNTGGMAAPPAYGQLAPGYPSFAGRPSRLPVVVASAVGVVLVVMLGVVATLLVSRGLHGRQQAAPGTPEIVSPATADSPSDNSATPPAVDGPAAPPPATNVSVQPAPAATQNVPVLPPAPPRDRAIVFPELLAAMNEQVAILRGIFNEAGAKSVAPRWAQCNRRAADLEREFNSTPPNLGSPQLAQAFQQQNQQLSAARNQIFQERGRIVALPGVMPALIAAEVALAGAGGQGSTPGQGGAMTIMVIVHQLPVAAHQHVQQRLLAIMGNGSVNGSGNGETATFTLTPVDDLDAFAAEIDFGAVTIDADRRTITVQADPAKLPKLEID